MSASITSGTYGRQPAFSGAFRQLFTGLFGSTRPAAVARETIAHASDRRLRVREANEVRELARSVEMQSPGFAADLYAAASRHEGLDD